MNKKKLIIIVFVVLVIVIGATIGTIVYENSRPYIVWTNMTYAGSTPLGWYNTTAYYSYFNTTRTESDYQTLYNYTFSVNTNTLTLMSIHDHCATLIPGWNDPTLTFTYNKINATCWNFNLVYNETGPSYWSTASTYGSGQTLGPSSPPLSQAQLDNINTDFRSQNS